LLSTEVPRLRDQFEPLVELTHHDPNGAPILIFFADYDQTARDLP
jgi:hypothetical protein